MYSSFFSSPLGFLQLTCTSKALTEIRFVENPLPTPQKDARLFPLLEQTQEWLTLYFQGTPPPWTPPLAPQGTEFQLHVWRKIFSLAYGKTLTYAQLSQRLAIERHLSWLSPQAVGLALSRNPILLMIPCHRIIGKNGELVGYSGGLERKKELLHRERVPTQGYFKI